MKWEGTQERIINERQIISKLKPKTEGIQLQINITDKGWETDFSFPWKKN